MTTHALAVLRKLLRRCPSPPPMPRTDRRPRRRDFEDTHPMLFRSEGFVEDLGVAYHGR